MVFWFPASIRQDKRLKHPHAPKDQLDYALNAVYNHSSCRGDEKIVYLQPDTFRPELGHRLFKNKRKVSKRLIFDNIVISLKVFITAIKIIT